MYLIVSQSFYALLGGLGLGALITLVLVLIYQDRMIAENRKAKESQYPRAYRTHKVL